MKVTSVEETLIITIEATDEPALDSDRAAQELAREHLANLLGSGGWFYSEVVRKSYNIVEVYFTR